MIRVATEADLDAVAETLARAFESDPVWGLAFADPEAESGDPGELGRKLERMRAVWGYIARAALPLEWVWLNRDAAAVALWIPPGQPEMPPADARGFEPFVTAACGPRIAPRALAFFARFEQAHPSAPPHYYLSLLGTHPDHAGQGLGMGLVAANLERIDAVGEMAFLESSNPANVRRYERLGFRPDAELVLAEGGPVATQMWRSPRPG